jgi:hypothetical protein
MKKQERTLKAYKVFNPDWTCKGFQYEIGKTYSIKEEPVLCERGFHACVKVSDCFNYYSFDPKNKVAEVELSGVILGEDGDKQVAQKITLLQEVSWEKMLTLANTGIGNSGYRNSGDSNSGNSNSGNWNSGNRNSGDSNSGNWNSGNRNSGYRNSGYRNSGYSNSGNWNSGNFNSGYFNNTTPQTILSFGKECDRDVWDNARKPNFISDIIINKWIDWSEMTDKEKTDNKNAFVTKGYLKTYTYKEAWANAYKEASKEDIKLLKALPNWNSDIFEDITGIKIK